MSTNAASLTTPERTGGQALDRFALFAASSGISAPRIAPKTLAIVVVLHIAVLAVLANYRTEVTPPQTPVMVTLVAPEPEPAPPQPEVKPPEPLPAAPRPVKKKAEPKPEKKPEPVPVVQPEPQLVSKAPETVPAPVAAPPAPVQVPVQEVAEAPAQPVAPPPAPPAPVEEPQVEPPSFNANYLDNPAPPYPSISRRLGEQGRVMLRVQVTPGGAAKNVVLHKTSGYDRLDRIALETVKRWKFVPARQGDKPVEAWVIVPIQFNLKG